jgi:hypothetical protein
MELMELLAAKWLNSKDMFASLEAIQDLTRCLLSGLRELEMISRDFQSK